MDLELKYGEGMVKVHIPESVTVEILEPKHIAPLPSVTQALQNALADLRTKKDFASPEQVFPHSVAIAIPDETRPLPTKKLLPIVLDWLFGQLPELQPSAVVILIGGGLHPPLSEVEIAKLVPADLARGCRVLAHDARQSPMVNYGSTSRNTPVLVNAAFARAEYKIVLGQIDPHQFVGFTGGAKGVVIGCGGAATIEHNHSLMFDDNARVGVLAGNPVREDLNEAGEKVGIDLAIGCVMAPNKDVVQILAGRPMETLTQGAEICAELYGVAIEGEFDIMVASCGGYPKDICLYQAQKGLNLASQAVKEGGNILLLAASTQGVGDDVYFDYVSQFTSPADVLTDFRQQEFRMGAHKAYLFGRTLTRFDVAVCSELDPGILNKCHLRAADPSKVIAEWVDDFIGIPRIGVVPNANTTYFYRAEK
jgi:lactate racemase